MRCSTAGQPDRRVSERTAAVCSLLAAGHIRQGVERQRRTCKRRAAMNMMPHAMASPRICTHRVVRRLAQHSAASGRVGAGAGRAGRQACEAQGEGGQAKYLSLVRLQASCMSSSAFKMAPER